MALADKLRHGEVGDTITIRPHAIGGNQFSPFVASYESDHESFHLRYASRELGVGQADGTLGCIQHHASLGLLSFVSCHSASSKFG